MRYSFGFEYKWLHQGKEASNKGIMSGILLTWNQKSHVLSFYKRCSTQPHQHMSLGTLTTFMWCDIAMGTEVSNDFQTKSYLAINHKSKWRSTLKPNDAH